MSSSSGSGGSIAQAGNRRPNADDLLIRSGCRNYHDWINAVRDEDDRTHSARTVRKILGAQVSWWQFLATRHRMPPPGPGVNGNKARGGLPSDAREIVYQFLGPVDFGNKMADAEVLRAIRNRALLDHIARAVAFYVDLARAAARAGRGSVKITQDTFNAAPKAAKGDAAVPMTTIGKVLSRSGYCVLDNLKRDFCEEEFDGMAFPITIGFDKRVETRLGPDFGPVASSLVVERLHNTDRIGPEMESRQNQKAAKIFEKVIESALQASAHWIEKEVLTSLGRGDLEFVLTEEMWEQSEQNKLPNGKRAPFNITELERDFKTYGRSGCIPRRLTVLGYLHNAMEAIGVRVSPTENGDHDEFPVRFLLKDFA